MIAESLSANYSCAKYNYANSCIFCYKIWCKISGNKQQIAALLESGSQYLYGRIRELLQMLENSGIDTCTLILAVFLQMSETGINAFLDP